MNSRGVHIAVASGKGGTGKTTIATNLAAVMSREGLGVIYADCDVEEPNGHLFLPPESERKDEVSVMIPHVLEEKCDFCGICAEVCQFNALAVLGSKVMLFPSLCHGCGACVVLCPKHAIHEAARPIGFIRSGRFKGLSVMGGSLNVGEAQAPPMTKALKKRLPGELTVIIDSPPGTSCPVVEAVRDADYVVLVTEPTPFGLNDLELAVNMLRSLRRSFGVIINRSDIGDARVSEYCRNEGLHVLMELPFDRKIAEAYSEGKLIIDADVSYREKLRSLMQAIYTEIGHV